MPSDAQQMDNKQLRIPVLATIQTTATGIIFIYLLEYYLYNYLNIFYPITVITLFCNKFHGTLLKRITDV
jgi:Na+-translocating ferredoxin:NAD+ oxidoreductase RnfE subunit